MSQNESVKVTQSVGDGVPIYRVALVREPTVLESSRTIIRAARSNRAQRTSRSAVAFGRRESSSAFASSTRSSSAREVHFIRSWTPRGGEPATATNKQGGRNAEANHRPAARSTRILEPDRDGSNDPELYSQVIDQEAVETVVGKKDRLAMAQARARNHFQGHRSGRREPLAQTARGAISRQEGPQRARAPRRSQRHRPGYRRRRRTKEARSCSDQGITSS